jgi:hypothetical protein
MAFGEEFIGRKRSGGQVDTRSKPSDTTKVIESSYSSWVEIVAYHGKDRTNSIEQRNEEYDIACLRSVL